MPRTVGTLEHEEKTTRHCLQARPSTLASTNQHAYVAASVSLLYQARNLGTSDGDRARESLNITNRCNRKVDHLIIIDHILFFPVSARAAVAIPTSMQRQHVGFEEPERKRLRGPAVESSVHEESDGGGGDGLPPGVRKMKGAQKQRPSGTGTSAVASIGELLQDFLEQQHRLDVERQEAAARQAQQRLAFEQQWRMDMQRLERERLMLEQAWTEREEQRRMREEARAERRDALLTNLLNRLLHDDL